MAGIERIPWLYDALCWLMELRGLRRWRLWLVGGARPGTLEVGCGTGRNLPLYETGLFLVATDPQPEALARARERFPQGLFVRARAEALPFRPGAFETVCSSLVFCSVADPNTGLSEVRRVLASGGEARMIEHVRSTSPLYARWQDFIQPLWVWLSGGCHTNRNTETLVEAAGLSIDAVTRRARGTMRRFVARARK